MAILMMLILPILEHGTCFHLFVSSFISFFSVVQFSEYRSFTSLVGFIRRYFIFLVAISNGIFSPDFCFCYFIVGLQKCLQFLNIDFVPHCFAKFTYQFEQFFLWSLQDFPCTLSCHLQTMTILLPPFQFDAFYFFFLSYHYGWKFPYCVEGEW